MSEHFSENLSQPLGISVPHILSNSHEFIDTSLTFIHNHLNYDTD